jgi:hypothetical protein
LPDCQYSKVESVAIDFDPTGNPIVAALGDPIVGGAIDFTGVSPPNTSAHQLPIFPSYSRKNLFLAAYSDQNNGQSLWAKQIPMILSSGIFGYGVDSHGYVVISGNYSGSMQADGRMLVTGVPEQEGYVDSFVAALAEPRQCGAPPTIGIGFDANGAQVDTVPAHIFAEATSPAGAVVFFTPPTAYDNCSPPGPGTIGGRPGATVYCAQPPNTTFGFGTSTVTCTAYDPFGDSSSTSFPVTVADTKPPVFAPFGDISRPATSAAGASVPFAPAATDQVDGSVTAVCTPASGTLFADGKTTPVTCTATDQHGNQSQMSFSVTVVPVPPTMTCVGSPGAPVIIATPPGTCGVTVSNGGAAGTCAGGAGGVASCTFDGHASETLGPGTHALAVLGTAGDGSTAGCTSYVQIVDDQSPTIQCADKTVECAGHTTTVTPAATCTDNCGCTVTCPPVALPLGTSLGGCTASDHTNSASCQSHLTVVDTRPPVLKLPCTTIVHGTGTSGAAVSYSASASDACDGAVAPSCSRASGSTFPYGITTVTCSASDAHGHTASGSFKVEVEYNWSGVLQPINADGSSIFKLGRTVPVKFQLTGGSAGVTNLLATLSLAHVSSSITGTYVEAVSTSAATTGNVFRYDATSKQYIFNLATDGLSAGTWRLSIDLGDGLARTVDISLR